MPTSVARIENFTGKDRQSVEKWIEDVEVCSRLEQVRENDRFDFAIQFLSDPVVKCVRSLTAPLEKTSGQTWKWDWIRLKVALKGIDKQTKKYTPHRAAARFLKLCAFGAVIGAAGPLALGLGTAVTAVCVYGGASVAVAIPDVMAGSRATEIVEETIGKQPSSSEIRRAIEDIGKKSPSYKWEDAEKFWPSVELVSELLELLVPNKNMH